MIKRGRKKRCIPWNKGKKGLQKHTEETKRKIGKAKKGNNYGSVNKGFKHSDKTKQKLSKINLGRKLTKETREKISKANKGKKRSKEFKKELSNRNKGEKSHFWKGGKMAKYPENIRIRKSIEYRLWREAVFARDNWTCQKCKVKGNELNAHHILNFAVYDLLRFAIDNGITFCKDCHKEFHKIYGKHNNTEEQLLEYLTHKLGKRSY